MNIFFRNLNSLLIQKTSTILLIFLWRTNEQPYDFMKKWAYFSIFEVKGAILASSIALLGIILFLSDNNKKQKDGTLLFRGHHPFIPKD